jgi:hypothetical protein
MEHDPLAQYRKTPVTPKGSILQQGDEDAYVAFGTKDKVRRLRICCPTIVHSPAYSLLLNVISDGKYGTSFILVYTVMMVMVRGKNLQKAVFAIENHMADRIEAFDPERWQKPNDAEAAFIESIEVSENNGNSHLDLKH